MAAPKNRTGVVYSTNPDFTYQDNTPEETETLPPAKQKLRVLIDKKQRAGKVVTVVTGFTGKTADLEALGKLLKTKCGTGGSVKDGEILIQGEILEKVKQALAQLGYTVK
ncbi:MAG: translation initiation factor [Bacteroidota bacterium]